MDRNEFVGAVIGHPVAMPYSHELRESGRRVIVHESLRSDLLPIAQPDTLHTFTGEAWFESQTRGMSARLGVEVIPWEDVEWAQDDAELVRVLSRAIVRTLPCTRDGVLRRVGLVRTQMFNRPFSWYVPDVFLADYVVDVTALGEYVETRTDVPDLAAYLRESVRTEQARVYLDELMGWFPHKVYLYAGLALWLDDCAVQECYEGGTFADRQVAQVMKREAHIFARGMGKPQFTCELVSKLNGMDPDQVAHEWTDGEVQRFVKTRLEGVVKAA